MPWCTGCDRFLSPSTVTPDGECPRCGAPVDPGRARRPASAPGAPTPSGPRDGPPQGSARADAPPTAGVDDAPVVAHGEEGEEEAPLPLPWHLKLLVGAIALYLGWRAFQGIEWVVRHL